MLGTQALGQLDCEFQYDVMSPNDSIASLTIAMRSPHLGQGRRCILHCKTSRNTTTITNNMMVEM